MDERSRKNAQMSDFNMNFGEGREDVLIQAKRFVLLRIYSFTGAVET
ncbi:MAG: hypothetical protein Q4F56_01540 [Candidatus Saccharibacteria bacterium]|nr:hypothetical protein [Candidatus Saccharibacteria bacterium]